MYAVCQGALGIECRADDEATLKLLADINDLDTALCCVAERSFLRKLVSEPRIKGFSDYHLCFICL